MSAFPEEVRHRARSGKGHRGPSGAPSLTLRLDRAKVLLRESDMNVAEIANEVGYRDANYFSKVFRKHTGWSPTEFAARHRQH